jgi:hypothetical protein
MCLRRNRPPASSTACFVEAVLEAGSKELRQREGEQDQPPMFTLADDQRNIDPPPTSPAPRLTRNERFLITVGQIAIAAIGLGLGVVLIALASRFWSWWVL